MLQTLELLKPSQEYPRSSPLGPDGEGELAGGEVRHGRQTSEGDMQLGSPSLDWRWWVDRGCHRRAAATGRWWRGREHSNSGEDRGRAGQCVARTASLGPSGCAEMVGWLGDLAEGGVVGGSNGAATGKRTPASSWKG
jgi:hypothetical protein